MTPSPERTSFGKRLTVPISVAFLILLGVVTFWAAKAYEVRLNEWRHTVEVQQRLGMLLSTLQDAETGQRGFLITGDETYLEPYRSAHARLPQDWAALGTLVADNPVQVRALQKLQPLLDARIAKLEEGITLRRAGRTEAALDAVRSGIGKQTMDRIRDDITGMNATEDRLLSQRSEASQRLSYISTALLAALLLTMLGGLSVLLQRERRDAQALAEANAEIRRSSEQLERETAERTKMESQVRQMQKIEAVGQLTGGIAHDFNNMLSVIIGNLELAARRIEDRTKLEVHLGNAQDAAKRAAVLTQRLLAFSRQQPLAPEVLDLNKFVSGMSELLLRSLGETIRVETILGAGLWRTFVDAGQVENAVLNLAVNARDAMPEGGRITIETANAHLDDAYAAGQADVKAGQYVLICVSDSGTGMPPEVLAKAFDPFFTTKGVGKGTGLGLSQIHGFIKQSGGHVKIYSEIDKGTTVRMYFPRYYGEEIASAPKTIAVPIAVHQGSPDQIVLVVEDEEKVRLVSVETLRSLGYTVRHAGGGHEALKILDELGKVDLLFTDVVMPGMTGRQIADAALARYPDLKVLYTTGYTRNAVVHDGVIDPGTAFLQKPFTIAQLSAKIGAVLAR